MDVGLRSPLLDFFRRGEAAPDVRLLAAQAGIAASAVEQLALLVLLTCDDRAEVCAQAEQTLSRLPADLVGGLIARSDVPQPMRDFFVGRGVLVAPAPLPDTAILPVADEETDRDAEAAAVADETVLVQRVAAMSVPQKVKAAMRGPREMRSILIRDSNKLVALTVLRSPKVTEQEVETFARMTGVDADVLRAISQTRAWVKSYAVAVALVRNPKTPLGISQSLLKRLNDADLRRLSMDRNVPEALRITARKKVALER